MSTVDCASAASASDRSGDWFIRGVGVLRGVENAPVDARWSDSKIFCSSSGRRGGAGPPKLLNGEEEELSERKQDVLLMKREPREVELNKCARGAELRWRKHWREDVAGFMAAMTHEERLTGGEIG